MSGLSRGTIGDGSEAGGAAVVSTRSRRVVLGGLLFALVAALGASACDSESFAETEKIEVIAEPSTVTFVSVAIGETSVQTFFVTNKSEKATAKLKFELLESPKPGDLVKEFGWDPNTTPSGTVEVTPGETIALNVTYTPQDTVSDSGKVLITTNGGNTLEVILDTNDIEPDISAPGRVIFGRVPAGGQAQKRVTIQNEGRAPLRLTDFSFGNNAEEFTFCFPQAVSESQEADVVCLDKDADGAYPEVLNYLETVDVRIDYAPTDDGEDETVFQIYSNDPDEDPFEVEINANGQEPCILVTDETGIDFGTAFIGQVSSRTITITNCSPNKDLEVDSITMTPDTDEEFFVDALPGNLPDETLIVPVDGTASFVMNYAPTGESANEGTLEIRSNDTAKDPLLVPVNGRGSNNACPIPVARARVAASASPWGNQVDTIPLATIEFDSSQSSDPDNLNSPNAISGYEWTIIDRPQDSTARFVPNRNVASPQLFLDLAGRYVIELRVFDAQNTPSCETAMVTILATPNEDIHVQLVWDTPGDPDQTDSGLNRGTDVDLHFLHPRGSWNNSPWDCYWLNVEPNWGSLGSSGDDPSLDIDDTDGSGPENINLNNPENTTYRVGAYYFSDHGYGPSYATIRIYLRATLVFEYRDKYLERTGKFWDVASIEWPAASVNQIDRVVEGFP